MAPSASTYKEPVLPACPPITARGCIDKVFEPRKTRALPDALLSQGGTQLPYTVGTTRVDELQLRTHSSSVPRHETSGGKSMARQEHECEEEFDSPSMKQAPSSASLCSWDGSSLSASSVSGDTPITSDCDSSDSSSPIASPAGYLSLSPLRGVSPTSPAANWAGNSASNDTEAAIAALARSAGLVGLRRYGSEVGSAEGEEEEEDEEEPSAREEPGGGAQTTPPLLEARGKAANVGEKAKECADEQTTAAVPNRADSHGTHCSGVRSGNGSDGESSRDRHQPCGAWSAKSALEDGKAAVTAARTGDVSALKEILARQPSAAHTRSHLV